MLTLSLPYPPSCNRLWRHERGGHRLSAEAVAWKRQAQWTALAAGCGLLGGDVEVALVLHPKLTKTGKASQTRLDLDNIIKIAIDSLNGLAYADDKQIVSIWAKLGDAKPQGGVTMHVGGFGEPRMTAIIHKDCCIITESRQD